MYAPKTLEAAWKKVKANCGAAGVDGQSIERFDARSGDYLAELSESLKAGQYRPLAIRRVEIPKGDGSMRPLGIPAVKDRIVQTAVKLVIEPVFEVMFHPSSYGFRPGRSCKDALREVAALIEEGHRYAVDADLKGYFDSIPHERLMERVRARIGDGRVLDLIEGWLKQDIMDGLEQWTPTEGTPQGGVISPLLANVYLHPLDEFMASHGYKMVRYADDFVVLCQSREEAEAALALIRVWVAENGLSLHPDKTHIGNCWKKGEGFSFLGYSFEGKRRHVRKKSLDRLKDKIRAKTKRTGGGATAKPRTSHRQSEPGFARLVQLLQARPLPCLQTVGRIGPETVACLPTQAGKASRLWPLSRRSDALDQRLLRGRGAVRTSHSLAGSEMPPMRKPPTGEPCAGKPHARFGGRGGETVPTPIGPAQNSPCQSLSAGFFTRSCAGMTA